jgi:peptide/nickel transport system permease protein
MAKLVVRQALYTLVVMGVASVVIFYALRLSPGDPVSSALNPNTAQEVQQAQRERLGLDEPIYQQYFVFMGNLLRGDFGTSILTGEDVEEVLVKYGLRTLALALPAMILAYLIAIPLGVLAAVRKDSVWDQLARLIANLGIGIPSFWLALLLILLFSINLHWFPPSGSGDLSHMVLPVVVLCAEGMAVTLRLMRTSMLEELNLDYVRALYAKGIRGRRVIWIHVVRNALLPVISLAGLRLGWLLGYALIVETVFNWPGLGFRLVDAVIQRDYPVAQAISLLLTLCVLLANFLANVSYAAVDPRLRRA